MIDNHELQDLKVENAVLRGSLYLTASSLKKYLDAKHTLVEDYGFPMLQLEVPEMVQEKATDALERANKLLQDQGQGRPR